MPSKAFKDGVKAGLKGRKTNPYQNKEPIVGPTLDAIKKLLGGDYKQSKKDWNAGRKEGERLKNKK